MARMQGITQQCAQFHGGRYKGHGPIGIVLHRTYTKRGWKSAYHIGLTGDGDRHVSFHFLIGKLPGYVVQFVDTDYVAWHAKGGNKKYIGIEFESLNNHDPLTGFQLQIGSRVIEWICKTHGIPRVGPPVGRVPEWHGVLAHANVEGSTHRDTMMPHEWAVLVPPDPLQSRLAEGPMSVG
jgi:N-acetyl-anhydromuramyl-L-alanine amidase AmpD